ncbi:MAG: OmpA family protein [Alphaproteobacteria bacterium]|nr:OmpA family protein [Alphaproteobacteria bacterium]
MKAGFYLFIILIVVSPLCFAQEKGYVPPPLFAEPRDPPPRPKTPETRMPMLSKEVENLDSAIDSQELLIKPRVIPAEPAETKPVIPPRKETKKAPPPTSFAAPSPSDNSKGVVKGPKVMPAVKKQDVDTEILFKDQNPQTQNILERVQPTPIQTEKQTQEDHERQVEEENGDKPSFDNPEMHKMTLTYKNGQSKLSEAYKANLGDSVVPALKNNKNLHIYIESYASPQAGQLNGDRRLALSRAMNLRSFLVERGVESERINVRSLGAMTDIKPLDRLEITVEP